jgi:hypothetical protein
VFSGSRELTFQAPSDGRVFVEDQQTQSVVFTKRVRTGQTVKFQGDNGQLSIDNRPVRVANLDQHRGHPFKMYFEKSE